jgi:hypothetical protein
MTTGAGSPITVEGHLWGIVVAASRNPGAFPAGTESATCTTAPSSGWSPWRCSYAWRGRRCHPNWASSAPTWSKSPLG